MPPHPCTSSPRLTHYTYKGQPTQQAWLPGRLLYMTGRGEETGTNCYRTPALGWEALPRKGCCCCSCVPQFAIAWAFAFEYSACVMLQMVDCAGAGREWRAGRGHGSDAGLALRGNACNCLATLATARQRSGSVCLSTSIHQARAYRHFREQGNPCWLKHSPTQWPTQAQDQPPPGTQQRAPGTAPAAARCAACGWAWPGTPTCV